MRFTGFQLLGASALVAALLLTAGKKPPVSKPIDGYRDYSWSKDYLNSVDDMKPKFKSYEGTFDLGEFLTGLKSVRFTDTILEKSTSIEFFEYANPKGDMELRAVALDMKVDDPDPMNWRGKYQQLVHELQVKYGQPRTFDPCDALDPKFWKFDTFNKTQAYKRAQAYRAGKYWCIVRWEDANKNALELKLGRPKPDSDRLTLTYLSKDFEELLTKAQKARDEKGKSKL